MLCKRTLASLIFFFFCVKTVSASDAPSKTFDVGQIKREITRQLAENMFGNAQEKPFLLLIGGYPGAGKTTLISALLETCDMAVINWNAIRQALLDRRLYGSPFDGEIIDEVNENLFRLCLERHVNIVLDANAHARNLQLFENLLKKEKKDHEYTLVKICLNPPLSTLFERVSARVHKEGLHQGTENDLRRDLNSSKKKIDLSDYALVIDTNEVPFETELKMVASYLESR
jgi:predicted kinase